MKFSLFVISTVALCLLQQTQARPSPLGNEVTNGATNGVTGSVTDTDTNVLGGLPVDKLLGPAADDSVNISGTAKREAPVEINSTVDKLLETVDGLLESITGSSGLLDITKDLGLDDLVGKLVGAVRSLIGKGGLVGEFLEEVTEILEVVLNLLESLGIDEIVDLSGLEDLVDELVGPIGGASKRGITPDVAGGALKKIDLVAVKGLLEKVQGLLNGVGLEGVLKPVLDIVNALLGGVVKGEGTKAGALRRALIKRAIERRAAL